MEPRLLTTRGGGGGGGDFSSGGSPDLPPVRGVWGHHLGGPRMVALPGAWENQGEAWKKRTLVQDLQLHREVFGDRGRCTGISRHLRKHTEQHRKTPQKSTIKEIVQKS